MNFLLASTPPVLLSNPLEPSNQKALIIKALSCQHFVQQTHNDAGRLQLESLQQNL